MTLKVFKADYDEFVGRGAYKEGEGIVIANSESEALGLCLEQCPTSKAKDWTITEVDTTKPSADVYIIER